MGMTFSQRMGYKPVKSIIQVNSIDVALRNGLWNNFHIMQEAQVDDKYFIILWKDFFKWPIDMETRLDIDHRIQRAYFDLEWYEVYDFIEFYATILELNTFSERFIRACNLTLERELSAYRFVEKTIVQITSQQEIVEIEEAVLVSKKFTQHLNRALELLADKKAPDYRNSIKESISAVEAICKLITSSPKVTLGDALRQLENKLGTLHPALRNAFNNLYGYTSDAEGIRHGMLGESELDIEDAKFMLIACSAFINYLVAKTDKAGIKLSPSKRVTKKKV